MRTIYVYGFEIETMLACGEEWPAPGLCPGSVGWKSFVTPSYCGFLVSSNSKVWRCHVAVYSAALAISSIMFSWVVTCSLISIFSGLPWTEKVPWKVIKERKIALTMKLNPSFELAIMFRECERPWAEIIWMCGLGELRLWILVLEKCGMLRWVFIGHEGRVGAQLKYLILVGMWGNINGECKLVHDYAPPRFSFGYQCGTVEVSFSLVFLWIFLLYCVLHVAFNYFFGVLLNVSWYIWEILIDLLR